MATFPHLPAKAAWRRLVEPVFAVIAIVIYSRALLFHLFTDLNTRSNTVVVPEADGPVTASSPGLLLVYITVYCITALLTITRWRQLLPYLRQGALILLLLSLAALSALWSATPGTTLARTVALGGSTLFALYWVLAFTVGQQLRLLATAFYLIIIACFLAVLLYPEIAIMTGEHQGLWQGVFVHKNLLGRTIALGSIAFFLLAAKHPAKSYLYWPGFWLALVLLLMSCSKATLLSYIVLFTTVAAYLAANRHYTLSLVALLSVSIASASLVSTVMFRVLPPVVFSQLVAGPAHTARGWDATLDAIIAAAPDSANVELAWPAGHGSDPASTATATPSRAGARPLLSGTGRKALWARVWQMVQLRPWLGYGYGGFWPRQDGPAAAIRQDLGAWARSAHNGFLDLLLDLGWPGLMLFVAAYSTAFFRAAAGLLHGPLDPLKLYFPMVLAYVFLINLGESELLAPNYLFWICIVCAAIYKPERAAQGPIA
jgi:exopolysaccharide production protein ExoQ